jgi:pilus assembly protein Flp/PilA
MVVPRRRTCLAAQNRQIGKGLLPMQFFRNFINNESGATAIEYGLIAGLISVVIIVAVTLVGTNLDTTFDAVAAALTPATTP